MFIVGENEKNSSSVSVRKRGEGDIGAKPLDEVIESLAAEVSTKSIF